MTEDLPLFDLPAPEIGRTVPSRSSDPDTSHAAAAAVSVRAGSQRAKMLAAYRDRPGGLTDDEAQQIAGVSELSCYWKRCSELREGELIAPTGQTRRGRAGVDRLVCVLTDAGALRLAALDRWDSRWDGAGHD